MLDDPKIGFVWPSLVPNLLQVSYKPGVHFGPEFNQPLFANDTSLHLLLGVIDDEKTDS
jgi:hypothetical protein